MALLGALSNSRYTRSPDNFLNNSLIGPHRLSSALCSGSDCSSGRAGSEGMGFTVRRNTICHISIISSEELERIKQPCEIGFGSWLPVSAAKTTPIDP